MQPTKSKLVSLPVLLLATALGLTPQSLKPSFLSFEDAQPILASFQQALPNELQSKSGSALAAAWPEWEQKHDAEIRGRMVRGDEDSMVNFLFFGTSFTHQPRVTAKSLEAAQISGELAGRLILARIEGLYQALKAPGVNERLLFLRGLVERQGYRFDDPLAGKRISAYLLENVLRVLREQRSYAKVLAASRQSNDATDDFITRSKLFEGRGLSLDTSFRPNYAIEQCLEEMKQRGLLKSGSIRRVAVIGPGLDFTDKENGYDFYPLQTLQPFAVIDSLLHLELGMPRDLRVAVFDISPHLLDHLTRAVRLSRRGDAYTVQLPLDSEVSWTPSTVRYWRRFGGRIGKPVEPIKPPAGLGVKLRAVQVYPSVVRLIDPLNLDIVLQHLDLAENEKFDLIVATNIFVYYEELEQTLALKNVEKMLRPGGVLLSNTALLELPGSQVRSVDNLSVQYSERPGDGDHIIWYQRQLK